MRIDELRAKRDAILAVAAMHGARNIRVFGSVARDEARAESDVDFLVEFEPKRSLLDHAGLIVALEDLLQTPVDVVPEDDLRPQLREQVLREAVTL